MEPLQWRVMVSVALVIVCIPWGTIGFRELLCGRRLDTNNAFIDTRNLVMPQDRRRRMLQYQFLLSVKETNGGMEMIKEEKEKGDDKMKQQHHGMNQSSNDLKSSSVSLQICDTDHGKEILSERGEIYFQGGSSNQAMLEWKKPPRRALLLMKPEEETIILAAKTAVFLTSKFYIDVLVESHFVASVKEQIAAITPQTTKQLPIALRAFRPQEFGLSAIDEEGSAGFSEEDGIDFVVSFGGDGLLLHASTLFSRSVPPHICINCGSMGFLTPFSCDRMTDVVRDIVLARKPLNINLRMRLSARILHNGELSDLFYALNEVAIQREGGSFMSNLECFCDDKPFTTVQADGLIIATPTGSTAYSMSAGGSVVHPNLLGILFTPICPHSLSFRPIVFPASVSIRCDVPLDARGEAVASFDGKKSIHLCQGDSLFVQMSPFPLPTICLKDSTGDWFTSLNSAFGFNARTSQKPLKNNIEQYQ